MPVDWDKFNSEIDSVIDAAADATDEKLASRVSSVTSMTDEEIKELFPEAGDVKKFSELMQIVNSAKEKNEKVYDIVDNAEKFGGVLLSLLQKIS